MGGTVKRGLLAGATGGLSEFAQKNPFGVNFNPLRGNFGGGDVHAPIIQGKQDPMQMLSMSGGAPLLMNVALGASVEDSIMGFFGTSKRDFNGWVKSLPPEDQNAVMGIKNQLSQIQNDTNLKNQAVQKLANDFPNIMAQKIPQYSALADDATKQMMDRALQDISAKQAAGGTFSSGATAAAAARAGAEYGMEKLNYGTGMAYQDVSNQYNLATGLQSFQQKMLGQGATMGFNAVQNALQRNAGLNETQAKLDYSANEANQQQKNAMWGALGSLGGTVLGGMFGGPVGAMGGNQVGGILGGSPRLNSAGMNLPNYGGYNRNV